MPVARNPHKERRLERVARNVQLVDNFVVNAREQFRNHRARVQFGRVDSLTCERADTGQILASTYSICSPRNKVFQNKTTITQNLNEYRWLWMASDLINGVGLLKAAPAAFNEHNLVIGGEKKRADCESSSHVVVDNTFRM